MPMTPEEFEQLLTEPEGARVEFKEARKRYSFDEMARYCVALANEGGGKLILGVTDGRPRRVVGTEAFLEPGQQEARLYERLQRRLSMEELRHRNGRVLIVHVPGRVPGQAWNDRGTYWMRAGESLVPMPDEHLRAIHAETTEDFSAMVCEAAGMDDLSSDGITEFRRRWSRRDGNERILGWSDEETLRNAELTFDGRLTYAALLLFGLREALGRYLAQAEVIFEYRSSEEAGPAQDRVEYREGFFLFHDRLWERINLRNDRQSYQDGFFRVDIPTFDENVIREAVLNAFCHRDYRDNRSIFVKQYARRVEIGSPGGLPHGVTVENILEEQNPRNRRLSEALARCGLVERAGQGMNLIFEKSIRQSKPLPDFAGTGAHSVHLTLRGNVGNPAFLRFLEKVGQELHVSFDTRDLLLLERLQRDDRVSEEQRPRIGRLIHLGVVEKVGRGRGTRYHLSRRFYGAIGRQGTYTRRRGLDREANKALLAQHLQDQAGSGSPMSELQQVLPHLSRSHLHGLLSELRDEGKARMGGSRRYARWYSVTTAP